MPFIIGHSLSLWIYTVLYTSPLLWGRVSTTTTTTQAALPAPSLGQVASGLRGSAALVCRAPAGHRGILFSLYRVTEQVDSVENQHGAEEAQFIVRVDSGSAQQNLFCCLYKDRHGLYSAFSKYLTLDHQQGADLTPTAQTFLPPVLSVEPTSGQVKRGQSLSFHCSLPSPQPQSQSQAQPQRSPIPVAFLLLKTAGITGGTSMVLHPQGTQYSLSTTQPGAFHLGPVTGGEGGSYACLYQFSKEDGTANSTVSNMVQITVTDLLPVPTLSLQHQAGVWHLLCTGSAAYPGAVFSLYLAGGKLPDATHQAPITRHHAAFPVPIQDSSSAEYQCQYRALLGGDWSTSEHSLPLAVPRGVSPPPSPELSGVDWPLVLGSFSAVVLFCFALALVAVVAHRKAQAAADEKKKREEAQFWAKVHAKDHVIDLTLRPVSFNSQEWAEEGTTTETVSRSPLWNPLSTFSTPAY